MCSSTFTNAFSTATTSRAIKILISSHLPVVSCKPFCIVVLCGQSNASAISLVGGRSFRFNEVANSNNDKITHPPQAQRGWGTRQIKTGQNLARTENPLTLQSVSRSAVG